MMETATAFSFNNIFKGLTQCHKSTWMFGKGEYLMISFPSTISHLILLTPYQTTKFWTGQN